MRREFVIEVRIAGIEPQRGEGPTKRDAEQDAAARLLHRLAFGRYEQSQIASNIHVSRAGTLAPPKALAKRVESMTNSENAAVASSPFWAPQFGKSNAGERGVGQKVSIVTRRWQTTRMPCAQPTATHVAILSPARRPARKKWSRKIIASGWRCRARACVWSDFWVTIETFLTYAAFTSVDLPNWGGQNGDEATAPFRC